MKRRLDENARREIAEAFLDFCETIAALRDPEDGCPWDLEQTHSSLRRYMLEEAYEAADVMEAGTPEKICEELGDVLLQVVLNAQVARDGKTFDIADVIRSIDGKMRRRHPHVFGTPEERQDRSKSSIKANWQKIKREEQKEEAHSEALNRAGVFDKASGVHPSLTQAHEIGKISSRANFDWDGEEQVMEQLLAEVTELEHAFAERNTAGRGLKDVRDEIGDVFFSLAQLCRHLGFDPELTSFDANRKFLRRFERVEELARDQALDIRKAPREALEELWKEAKKNP